ncbi:hypothetical protein [Bacillus tuaregi]|uniref:hypothetical protein n=1 Tax=Bacillus tuaregi TaxID=1816695 RepID=UPI0008F9568F|nr:hypothetical protein [Bacillus tuaregi]
MPFLIFAGAILFAFLINDGYTYFENQGWNPIFIVAIRKGYYIALAILAGLVSYFLFTFYKDIVSDWKDGHMFSDFNKVFEIIFITIFVLGPAIYGLFVIFQSLFILFGVSDSYWEGIWDLDFR